MVALCVSCYSPHYQRYKTFMEVNAPGKLATAQPTSTGIRPEVRFHVRVYADESYRHATLRWEAVARRRVDQLSTFVRDRFGVRLACDSVVPWRLDVPQTGNLTDALAALRKLDSGEDVDWVIAFVGPALDDNFGVADLASKHIIVRPGFWLRERQTAAEVKNMNSEDMELLIRERAEHREAVIFLRTWATSLGVPTDNEFGSIQAPSYRREVSEFSPASKRAIEVGLRYRFDWTPSGRKAWREAMLALIAEDPAAFSPAAADEVRAWSAR